MQPSMAICVSNRAPRDTAAKTMLRSCAMTCAQGGSRVAPPQGNRFGHRTASKVACSITAPAITTCQHDEGVEGSAGQNPIRDLKQVNRNGQHQQVCGASLDHDRAEVAAHDLAAPLQLLNKLLRPCVFVELWR